LIVYCFQHILKCLVSQFIVLIAQQFTGSALNFGVQLFIV